jgi:hypothetical protein
MKYLIFAISFFLIYTTPAQTVSFEGVITWRVSVIVVNDAETEAYKQKILDEDNAEINETIIELEHQLNDPEMQYMLLENPTIKGTMQKKLTELKAIQAANEEKYATSFFPTAVYMYRKNGNSFTKIDDGCITNMTGNMLYLKDKSTTYFIKDGTKTISVLHDTSSLNKSDHLIQLQKTTDTITILNYKCIKYILTKEENGKVEKSTFWITNEITNMSFNSFRALSFISGNLHHEAYQEVGGIPLKVEYLENGFTMTIEATDILATAQNDSKFIVPSNYKNTALGF